MPAKLKSLLTSRRFWALVLALLGIVTGAVNSQISYWQALEAMIAAIGAYIVAVGLEESGKIS